MNSMSRDCKTGEKMLTDTEELYNKLEARANKIDELRKSLRDIGVFLSTVEFMLNEAERERDELRGWVREAIANLEFEFPDCALATLRQAEGSKQDLGT
jgi:predicted nuclease with TOPRIM domain